MANKEDAEKRDQEQTAHQGGGKLSHPSTGCTQSSLPPIARLATDRNSHVVSTVPQQRSLLFTATVHNITLKQSLCNTYPQPPTSTLPASSMVSWGARLGSILRAIAAASDRL